ncbi:MAG: DUF5915 domain-containing protein, partial [Archaeoglobaceae archaeon]
NVEISVKSLKPKFAIIGPMFKDKAKKILEKISQLEKEDLKKLYSERELDIEVENEKIRIRSDWFEFELERKIEGKKVVLIETKNSLIFIEE